MCLMLDQFLWGHSSRVCDISCFFCIYRLLNSSLSNAENPLRAARVYDNIAAAILEAEEAARKAKEDANNAINIVSSYF